MRPTILLLLLGLFAISCDSNTEVTPSSDEENPVNVVDTLNTSQLITDIQYLSSDQLEGRYVGSVGSKKAQEYILNRFEQIGGNPFQGSYIHPFEVQRKGQTIEAVNLIGTIPGTIDDVILITAHYDHLEMQNNQIYNGADDNASGTAGLLAMMDYFSKVQPTHTMVFAALDAEEGGLNGAVDLANDSTFLKSVKFNINMDMISQNDKNELYAVGTYHFPEIKPVLEGVETGNINLLFGHDRPEDGNQDWTYASDHGAFFRKGVPFIYFGVEDHTHYHAPSDEFETIPQEFYKNSTQAILNAVLTLDEYLFN